MQGTAEAIEPKRVSKKVKYALFGVVIAGITALSVFAIVKLSSSSNSKRKFEECKHKITYKHTPPNTYSYTEDDGSEGTQSGKFAHWATFMNPLLNKPEEQSLACANKHKQVAKDWNLCNLSKSDRDILSKYEENRKQLRRLDIICS